MHSPIYIYRHSSSPSQSMKAKYISDFVCTYDLIDEYENSFWLYQIQLLQAFNLEQFDDNKINMITQALYEKYKDNTYISSIIKVDVLIQNQEIPIDDLTRFRLCFEYDTFYLIHSILCSIINNFKMNELNYKKLLAKKSLLVSP